MRTSGALTDLELLEIEMDLLCGSKAGPELLHFSDDLSISICDSISITASPPFTSTPQPDYHFGRPCVFDS